MADPPGDLLGWALECAGQMPGLVQAAYVRGTVPESRVLFLLEHQDPAVAGGAALAEWHADPAGRVRPGLQRAWRAALLRCPGELPEDVLQADPDLARDWLAARFQEDGDMLWHERSTAQAAYAALDTSQRLYLLERVPGADCAAEAVRRL